MYKKLSLPYSTMHELATHTHTYAHIIILLTCGCNVHCTLQCLPPDESVPITDHPLRPGRRTRPPRSAWRRAPPPAPPDSGPIRPMLSYITCTARPTPSLTNRPQSEDVTPTAMICVPTDDSCHTKSPNKEPQIMPTVRLMER